MDALVEAFATPRRARSCWLGSDAAAFSAGADLRLADDERAEVSDLLYELYGVMTRVRRRSSSPRSTGAAVGGGAQLAIAADLRVGVARRAASGSPAPGTGSRSAPGRCRRWSGAGSAMDLCLTMRGVDAEEALAIGLVDRLADDAAAAGLELAAELAALDAAAAARVKRVAWASARALDALEEERAGNRAAWSGSVTAAGAARG